MENWGFDVEQPGRKQIGTFANGENKTGDIYHEIRRSYLSECEVAETDETQAIEDEGKCSNVENSSGVTHSLAWKPRTEEQLNNHLNLSNAESRSLQTLLNKISEILCFTVEIGKDKNVIILRQTGAFDWWNRLNPKVSIGYEKIGKLDGEPRLQRICVACASLSGLRQALRDVRAARIKSKFTKKSVRLEAKRIDTWHIASAIVVLHTLRYNLRTRGSFTWWCQRDMKDEEGFKVDAPICISAGVALTVDGTSLRVKIDDGLLLQLAEVGRVPRNYMGKTLLCAQPELLKLRDNGEVDEFNSEWDVSDVALNSSDEVPFSVSSVNIYLH